MKLRGVLAVASRKTAALLASLFLLSGALLATSALAHGARHGGAMAMDGSGMLRMVDRILDGVNASEAQRSQVNQIAQTAAADLKAQGETMRALRGKALQVFTAPNVDAAAAESLRQQMQVQHDLRSHRTIQAMLEISAVLTSEQRTQIGERLRQRQERWQERRKEQHEREQSRRQ